jgi:hypothetical membrane protein
MRADPRELTVSRNEVTRRLAIGGLVGPIGFVLTFTVAGLLRPGYSPIHQTISDLGVGANRWLVDAALILNGLLIFALVIAVFRSTRTVLSPRSRWLASALLTLSPLGFAVAGIFTEAPSTLAVHWLIGANLGLAGPVVAFLVTGVLLRRDSRWRAMGTYSLVAGAITLVLVGFMGWVFTPGTALAGARLGGLMERAVVIEVFAWYVAVGWWLLRGGSESVSAVPEAGPRASMSTDLAP